MPRSGERGPDRGPRRKRTATLTDFVPSPTRVARPTGDVKAHAWCYLCASEHAYGQPCMRAIPVRVPVWTCEGCGGTFVHSAIPRSRVYCSEACRATIVNARKRAADARRRERARRAHIA